MSSEKQKAASPFRAQDLRDALAFLAVAGVLDYEKLTPEAQSDVEKVFRSAKVNLRKDSPDTINEKVLAYYEEHPPHQGFLRAFREKVERMTDKRRSRRQNKAEAALGGTQDRLVRPPLTPRPAQRSPANAAARIRFVRSIVGSKLGQLLRLEPHPQPSPPHRSGPSVSSTKPDAKSKSSALDRR